jgi:hypothetical protein
VEVLGDMLPVVLVKGMLSMGLMKVGDGWLRCSAKIGSMSEVGLGCFGVFEVETVRDRMVSIVGGWESTTWYGLLL